MPTREIHPEHWKVFLKDFVTRHEGQPVTIEVMSESLGDFVEERRLRLADIETDLRHHGGVVSVLATANSGIHLTHEVEGLKAVRVLESGGGAYDVLQLEAGDGTITLLRLEPTPTR
jgi:hypothetical protein